MNYLSLERLLCPIFLGNFTPKTSNYCPKNRALGFPGAFFLKEFDELKFSIDGGFKYCKCFILIFNLIPGAMIQFDEHIFQMGWFNHQLDKGYNPSKWRYFTRNTLEN